jgi:hypothetical protein
LGCRRVNMFENRKMKTGESISGMGKGRWWRGWIQLWYIYYKNFCKYHIVPPVNNNMIIKNSKKEL